MSPRAHTANPWRTAARSIAAVAAVGALVVACSGDDGQAPTNAADGNTTSPVTDATQATTTTSTATTVQTTTSAPTTQPSTSVSARFDGWIAYQSGTGVAFVRPDGSEPASFAVPNVGPHHPDWSPDATKLAYVVDETDGTTDIWAAAIDGHDAHRIIDCQPPCQYADDPSWSPDGTRLVYWTTGHDDPSLQQLVIADAVTGETLTTINAGPLTGPVNAKFSPDGNRLVFEVRQYEPAGNDFRLVDSAIAIADLTATPPVVQRITDDGMLAGYPDWNPAGDRIIFQAGNLDPFSHTGVPPELFTLRPDGTELTQITHYADGDPWLALPDWSADPARPILVTAIAGPGDHSLVTVDFTDGTVTPLTGPTGPIRGAHPRRSPTS